MGLELAKTAGREAYTFSFEGPFDLILRGDCCEKIISKIRAIPYDPGELILYF